MIKVEWSRESTRKTLRIIDQSADQEMYKYRGDTISTKEEKRKPMKQRPNQRNVSANEANRWKK